MATQPWKPSWYVGPKNEHPRDDIVQVFWDTLEEAAGVEGFVLHEPGRVIQDYGIIGQ